MIATSSRKSLFTFSQSDEASAAVRRIRAFGDDAFRAGARRLLEDDGAVALDEIGVANGARQRARAVSSAALYARAAAVHANPPHPARAGRRRGSRCASRRPPSSAATSAAKSERPRASSTTASPSRSALAHGSATAARASAGKRVRPIEPGARIDARALGSDRDLQPVAVILQFEHPIGALGRPRRRLAELRLDEVGRRRAGDRLTRSIRRVRRADSKRRARPARRARFPRACVPSRRWSKSAARDCRPFRRKSSRSLTSNQFSFLSRDFMRTRTQRPRMRAPCARNLISPFSSASRGSPFNGS